MRNDRVPIRDPSHSRRGVAVVDVESGLAGRSLIESPKDFVVVDSDHEPRSSRTTAPKRCCRRLVGRASLRFLGRQDAGSTLRFMESPLSLVRMHWDHEPTPNPSQEGNWHDADERLLPSREGSGVGRFMASASSVPGAFISQVWNHFPGVVSITLDTPWG